MNVPRHKYNPIDTSIVQRMTRKESPKLDKVGHIRKIIRDITGYDPYMDPSYRGTKYVTSRQLFLYFVHHYAGFNQTDAATILGKDHSTVVHACNKVEQFRKIETSYKDNFDKILFLVKQIN